MREILNRPGTKVRWLNFAAVIGIPYTSTRVMVHCAHQCGGFGPRLLQPFSEEELSAGSEP